MNVLDELFFFKQSKKPSIKICQLKFQRRQKKPNLFVNPMKSELNAQTSKQKHALHHQLHKNFLKPPTSENQPGRKMLILIMGQILL